MQRSCVSLSIVTLIGLSTFLSVGRNPVHAEDQFPGIGAMGDSLTDEYSQRASSYGDASARNWVDLLAQLRGPTGLTPELTFGDYQTSSNVWGPPRYKGYDHNFALWGANTATLLSQGQHNGVVTLVRSGQVKYVAVFVGTNDFQPASPYGTYADIYNQVTPFTGCDGQVYVSVENYVDSIADQYAVALEAVLDAGGRPVMATIADFGMAPRTASDQGFSDPEKRQHVTDAVTAVNGRLKALATTEQVPIVDLFALMRFFYMGPEPALVGGVPIIKEAPLSPDARYAILPDGAHPGTVVQGLMANAFVEACNRSYGAKFTPLSDQEILVAAGVEYTAEEETFFDIAPFVTIPSVQPGAGSILYVDDDGPADFDNIQEAIDAANDGDTVLVAPGEYVSDVPLTFRGKSISVRSEAGFEATTIQMADSPRNPNRASTVVFENGERQASVLEGFTISGGQGCWSEPISGYGLLTAGGGILCADSSPTIAHCVIAGNRALLRNEGTTLGGGVLLANSSAVLTDCRIVDNTTTYWAAGMYVVEGAPEIVDCVIARNSVLHEDGQAGGLYIDGGFSSSCQAILLRCTIAENSAPHSAGGIQVAAGAQPTLNDCVISDNRSQGGNGGMLCSYWSATNLMSCTIAGNSCVRIGGGVGCGHSAEAILTNCTITGNRAGRHSGGVVSYDKSAITLRNCIVSDNTAPSGPEIGLDHYYYHTPTSMTISHCDIRGGLSAAHIGQGTTLNWEEGNIDSDPLFADPNEGDFHLKSEAGRWDPNSETWGPDDVTSPCVDAGDPNSPVAFEPFPNGARVNMGAYGGTPEASKSPSGLHAKYGGGTGEPNDPYLIHTAEHLNALGAEPNDYDKHFKLMADIDLSGYMYDRAVIAPDVNDGEHWYQGTAFTGVFDGTEHVVSHLTIRGGSFLGLFARLGSGSKVSNIVLEGTDVNGIGDQVGGLVGQNWGGYIVNCHNAGRIIGGECVGGLVGRNGELFSTGDSLITNCYSIGEVRGGVEVGGLVGRNYDTVVMSHSAAEVIGYGIATGMGGQWVVGHSVGGLIGHNHGHAINSYSVCSVSGLGDVGGLIGRNGYLSDAGIIPSSFGSIVNCYSAGSVHSMGDKGGLVGTNLWGQAVKSFWDIETSGQTNMCGCLSGSVACCDNSLGKTTAQMQTASTFLEAGWDFIDETENGTNDIWWILEGKDYPRLWWELISEN